MSAAEQLHTPEQLDDKRMAIQKASGDFARSYLAGDLSATPELLYDRIENLCALVRELKAG
jgi:hypothetical protein